MVRKFLPGNRKSPDYKFSFSFSFFRERYRSHRLMPLSDFLYLTEFIPSEIKKFIWRNRKCSKKSYPFASRHCCS